MCMYLRMYFVIIVEAHKNLCIYNTMYVRDKNISSRDHIYFCAAIIVQII